MKIIELIQILEDKIHNLDLVRAVNHDVRMSFYNDRLYKIEDNKYAYKFVENVKIKLSNIRSIESFQQNINFPFEINSFTSEIIDKLSEIWNGQNAVFQAYFKKALDKEIFFDLEFYKNDLFSKYFKAPNSLIYLAYEDEKIKYNFINSNQILEYKKTSDKNIFKYVIFESGENIYYIDKEELIKYSIEGKDYDTLIELERTKLIGNKEVPIYHISNELYNSTSDFVRTNILVNSLSYFDLLQEVIIYKKMVTPYAFNLLIEKYRNPDCNYKNGDAHCENGYLYNYSEDADPVPIMQGHSHKNCPVCNSKVSPGTIVEKSSTFSLEKSDTISDVIKFIAPDTSILAYSDTFIEKLKEYILNSLIGKTKEQNNNQNANESAVNSANTDKLTVIMSLKGKFEKVIKNIENGRASWLFKSNFDSWTINLGTNFLLKTLIDLYKELEFAKLNNVTEIKNIQKQIISTKYSTDKIAKKRALVLLDFYPEVDITNELVSIELKKKQLMFNDFIQLYESENENIGLSLDDNRIILKKLDTEYKKYIKNLDN